MIVDFIWLLNLPNLERLYTVWMISGNSEILYAAWAPFYLGDTYTQICHSG